MNLEQIHVGWPVDCIDKCKGEGENNPEGESESYFVGVTPKFVTPNGVTPNGVTPKCVTPNGVPSITLRH